MPQTVPHPWLQHWYLSPPIIVQFQHDHSLLPNVMVSIHTVHAQNMSNTLLAIKYHKTNKHYSLAYHSISHTPYNPYPASTRTHFMLQLHVHSNASSLSNIINAVLCINHTNLEFQPCNNSTYTCLYLIQCQYCVHPWKKVILHVKFGLWMHHLVHSFITDALHAIKKPSFSVVAYQFPSCTFIHESPWHNCVTILRHSKYEILVYPAKIPKIVQARFNIPLHHLHRLNPILMDVHNFKLQQYVNCYLLYKCHKLYLVCGLNVGTFLHQQLRNLDKAITCCPK